MNLDKEKYGMKEVLKKYYLVFWIFIMGSIFGFVWENILTLVKGHYALRQGLLFEPLIPIYGIGALVYFLVYRNIKININNKYLKVFILFMIGFLLGGFTEYMLSFLQEKIFQTVSWDYSNYPLNINGRTSVLHASSWGMLGVVFYYFVIPLIERLKNYFNDKWFIKVTLIWSVFLLNDCFISGVACYRQKERIEGVLPENKLEVFMDTYFTDEYLGRIFTNARFVEVKRD